MVTEQMEQYQSRRHLKLLAFISRAIGVDGSEHSGKGAMKNVRKHLHRSTE